MSDIFLSYSSHDRATAKALAGALERHGWTVWWDRRIPTGKDYGEVIETQLGAARCVIVLWSQNSVASEWVKTEAADAKDRRLLVPVLIEAVKLPLEFRRVQAADLTDWKGEPTHAGFSTLVSDLTTMLGPSASDEHATGSPRQLIDAEPAEPVEEPPAHARGESHRDAAGRISEEDAGRVREEDAGRPREEDAPAPPEAEAQRATNADAVVARKVIAEEDAGRRWHTPPRPIPYRIPLVIFGVAVAAGLMFILFRSCGKSPDTPTNLNVVNMRTPTPRPSPTATPGNTNGASGPPDNRAPDPERARRLGLLLQQLKAVDERTRRAATSEMKNRHASDPQAVEQALDLLDESKVGELSPQALVNVLFFLNNTTREAWTTDSYQKARAALQRLEGMNLAPQAQGELRRLKLYVTLVPER